MKAGRWAELPFSSSQSTGETGGETHHRPDARPLRTPQLPPTEWKEYEGVWEVGDGGGGGGVKLLK